MDDNLAYYRRFCASRLKRLERCKKTKSFCNLDDDVLFPVTSSDSERRLARAGNFEPSNDVSGCCLATTHSRTPATALPCRETSCSISLRSGMDAFHSHTVAVPCASTTSEVGTTDSKVRSLSTSSWLEDKNKLSSVITKATDQQSDSGDPRSSSPACSSPCSSSSISPGAPSLSSTTQNQVSPSTITVNSDEGDAHSNRTVQQKKFDLLREKMISLMENDVRLLQQLLALGDSIQELKSKNDAYANSRMSLNSLEEEEDGDEETWCRNRPTRFGNSLSAITNLYVDDEPEENQNKQYFSRKNSVLRIPIPPRSSNRMSTNKKLQRRLSRLSQHCERYHHHQQQHGLVESSSQTADGVISKQDFVPITVMTAGCSAASAQSAATGTGTNEVTFGNTNTRISNGSIDSGIRDESCSNSSAGSLSPALKDEKF